MTTCNAPHPTLSGVRCDRTRGHRGDHGAGDTRWPRGARGGRQTETASIVLTALAAGATYEAAGAAAGVSKQRAAAIAASAGGRPGATVADLLAELRRDAMRAGLSPQEYLREAREAIAACERIVERLTQCHDSGIMDVRDHEILRMAIGRNEPELAAQVRAAVEATSTDEP